MKGNISIWKMLFIGYCIVVQNGLENAVALNEPVWASSSAVYEETPIKCTKAEEFWVKGIHNKIHPILLQLVF